MTDGKPKELKPKKVKLNKYVFQRNKIKCFQEAERLISNEFLFDSDELEINCAPDGVHYYVYTAIYKLKGDTPTDEKNTTVIFTKRLNLED